MSASMLAKDSCSLFGHIRRFRSTTKEKEGSGRNTVIKQLRIYLIEFKLPFLRQDLTLLNYRATDIKISMYNDINISRRLIV